MSGGERGLTWMGRMNGMGDLGVVYLGGDWSEGLAMVTVNETLVREILDRLIRLETLVVASNEETNRRIDETNRRIDETNARIEETNRRTDETNARLDNQVENLRREFRAELTKQTYLILGTGAAIVAAVLATNLFG